MLPFQLCSSQAFYPGATKHASVFDHESSPHHILITAVSVWKKATQDVTQPATLEFLAFIKPVKRAFCKKDSGSHCASEISGKMLPPVRCDFVQPGFQSIFHLSSVVHFVSHDPVSILFMIPFPLILHLYLHDFRFVPFILPKQTTIP